MLPRSVVITMCVPFLLVGAGAVGFHVLEDLDFDEALYLTVITLTTVGYGDIVPRTSAGRFFTMVLVLSGVFTVFYAATSLIRVIVTGELRDVLGKQQMERTLEQLKDHIIVCGYGRMGRLVCKEFSAAKVRFVVIDASAEVLRDFEVAGGMPLVGDATSDEVLKHAGIERARGLVTVMASDADNLFTTMSARLLNSKLTIVARVEDVASETKLMRAGANRVVSPYQIGGNRVAHAILRPTVMDFVELATKTEHIELQLEETRIGRNSSLAGQTLQECRHLAEQKIIIVAIKKSDGKMQFKPRPDVRLQVGDILVAIGHKEHLQDLEALANPPG